jgi:hypothetical protein
MVSLDPLLRAWFQAEAQLGRQPHAPQQPQGVVEQVGFAHGHQSPPGEISQATGGIHQLGPWRQGQGDGVDGVVAPP